MSCNVISIGLCVCKHSAVQACINQSMYKWKRCNRVPLKLCVCQFWRKKNVFPNPKWPVISFKFNDFCCPLNFSFISFLRLRISCESILKYFHRLFALCYTHIWVTRFIFDAHWHLTSTINLWPSILLCCLLALYARKLSHVHSDPYVVSAWSNTLQFFSVLKIYGDR